MGRNDSLRRWLLHISAVNLQRTHPIPLSFPGTGDIYSAVFTGKVMAGMGVQEANAIAIDRKSVV